MLLLEELSVEVLLEDWLLIVEDELLRLDVLDELSVEVLELLRLEVLELLSELVLLDDSSSTPRIRRSRECSPPSPSPE